MCKKSLKIAILAVIFGVLTGIAAYALPFPINSDVYMSAGTSGDGTTANSFGRASMYRPAIANEKGTTILYPSANYSYFPADGTYPAYYDVDMGTVFNTPRAIGQIVRGIVEVYPGLNGYAGSVSYVGATSEPITTLARINLHKVSIQPMPTPRLKEKGVDGSEVPYIIISWEGVATSDATGIRVNSAETYAVYYSTASSGLFTFEGIATHVSGEVTYTHSGVSSANMYYYKLKMRYAWPGNSPAYFETNATSVTSEGIRPLAPGPVVSGISPSRTNNTGIKSFTVSGTYLTDANGVSLRRVGYTDVSTNAVTVISDTTLLATIELNPAIQTIGTWDVRVTNPTTYGTGTGLLTLTAEAPYIASVEPITSGTNLTLSGFKIYGDRLYPDSSVRITRGSVTFTASSVTTNSGFSRLICSPITLTNATIGTWDVTVTSLFNQTTRESYFTVTAEAPTATSITPATGTRGTTVSIASLVGTNLFSDTVVKLQRAGYPTVDATGITANAGHTSLGFNLPIYATAETGSWNIYIGNSDGQSVLKTAFFTITAAPTVAAISPATAENSGPVSVTITGSNFFAPVAASLEMTGQSTIAATITSSTDSTINCSFNITGATIGSWDVVVVNRDGSGRKSAGFLVTSEAPTFASITPNSRPGGFTYEGVTISGDNFYTGATVQLRKTGRTTVTATAVTRQNINTLTCTLALPNQIPDVGTWDVYVQNTDTRSTIESGAFTVTYGSIEAPSNCTITSLSPTAVSISWSVNSINEESFNIEKSTDGSTYSEIGTTAPAATSYTGSGTTGLLANTRYWFRVRAYGGGSYTTYSTASPKYTFAAPPSAEAFGSSTSTVITANWSAGDNPSGTTYYCKNLTNSNNSGNITALTWQNTGLLPYSDYAFGVWAINGDGVSGEGTTLGISRTREKKSVYYFAVDGVRLLSGDILASTANISVVFSSEAGIDVSSFRMYIDGRQVTDGTNTYYDTYSTDGIFTTVNYKIKTALTEGTYTILASANDPSGILFEDERTDLQVMSEATKLVVGYVLPYPNPYDPTKGTVKLTYRLATDTNTTIYVFDVNGRLVWKQNYSSAFNGGKAGYNEILWNGYDAFSRMLDNDVYLIRIVETGTGKVMGKGKLVVVKTVSRKKDDGKTQLAAGPLDSGSGPDSFGGAGGINFDIAKLFLLSVVGLIAFEELARMYISIKKIGGLKR